MPTPPPPPTHGHQEPPAFADGVTEAGTAAALLEGGDGDATHMLATASRLLADGEQPPSPAGYSVGAGARAALTEGGVALRIRRRTTVGDLAALLAAAASAWSPAAATVFPAEVVFAAGGGPEPDSGRTTFLRNAAEALFTATYYLGDQQRLAQALGTAHASVCALAAGSGVELSGHARRTDPATPAGLVELAELARDLAFEVDAAKTRLRGRPQSRDAVSGLDGLAHRLRELAGELAQVGHRLAEGGPQA